jgi:hypothetical protein
MTLRFTPLFLALVLSAGTAFTQSSKRSKETDQAKAVTVHIDGFMKSKSGAV